MNEKKDVLVGDAIKKEWILKQDKEWIVNHYLRKNDILAWLFLVAFVTLCILFAIQSYVYDTEHKNDWKPAQVKLLADKYCEHKFGAGALADYIATTKYNDGARVRCVNKNGNQIGREVYD